MVNTIGIFVIILLFGVGVVMAQRLRAGKNDSLIEDLSPEAFKEKMGDKGAVLIDVRTTREAKSGKISGAQVIDYMSSEFAQKVQRLDKDKTYLLYCRSGARSAKACRAMEKLGFTQLYNLNGGFLRWKKEI